MRELACICPQCNRWIFVDELPTPVCPGCGKHIENIVWRDCPRCSLPTDASQPMCQNCSAAFDSLFEDEVIGDSDRLFVDEEGHIIGVVSKDTAESPWSSQEDVEALYNQLMAIFLGDLPTGELESLISRLSTRIHYWRWVYGRGGTAIPITAERFESVDDRIGALGSLAFPLLVKMSSIARSN